MIREISQQAETEGVILPLVSLAHPGRFLPDGHLARGSTLNLGPQPDAFDGRNPARELTQRLDAKVFAENDATAQMRYGLHELLRDPEILAVLLNETVVYLGPGTGLGGGVATISADGAVTTRTDGHLFDVQVPGVGDGTRIAEELFSGPVIAQRLEALNTTLSSPILPANG